MRQNALDQSDCNILKLTISLEQNDKKSWFFAYWSRFREIKGAVTVCDILQVVSSLGV